MDYTKSDKKSPSDNSAPAPLQFLSPLHKATRQISLYFEQLHTTLGVSPSEGHLLTFLLSYGPCSVGELLRVLGHKKSTLTSILDRLEERRYLVREINRTDRRSFLVELTAEGKGVGRKVRRSIDGLEKRIAEHVSARSLSGFQQVMQAIATVTEVDVRPPGSTSTAETMKTSRKERS